MTLFTVTHPWAFAVGLLGNVISFAVYLAPLQTFYRIYKKKSTEGFQSIPYIVALFSSMLWMYYGFLKSGAYLLITINSFGCVVETIYIAMYLTYAPSMARILTTKLLLLFNLGGFSSIILLTVLLVEGQNRIHVLGWVCVAFSISVFVAPLSIMRLVIRTKSVEFMPFSLSFFLMISAITWFAYGFLLKDIYIALPNVIGFVFGILQMVLYAIYKNKGKVVEEKQLEQVVNVIKLSSPNNVEECVVEIQDVHCNCRNNIDEDHQKMDEPVDSYPQHEMKFNQFEAQIPAIKA